MFLYKFCHSFRKQYLTVLVTYIFSTCVPNTVMNVYVWLTTIKISCIIADALEAGPLRREEYVLPAETAEAIRNGELNGVPAEVIEEVVRFYLANRREDTDWVVLPVANCDCFFGNTNFSRKWLNRLPEQIVERSAQTLGVCRIKVKNELCGIALKPLH